MEKRADRSRLTRRRDRRERCCEIFERSPIEEPWLRPRIENLREPFERMDRCVDIRARRSVFTACSASLFLSAGRFAFSLINDRDDARSGTRTPTESGACRSGGRASNDSRFAQRLSARTGRRSFRLLEKRDHGSLESLRVEKRPTDSRNEQRAYNRANRASERASERRLHDTRVRA